MTENPLISIVLPVRNRAHLLNRTLRSIAAQTLRPLKVIAVDNASTDQSLEMLTKWAEDVAQSGLEVTILQEDKPGASAARNCGLREVTTPYVMFFDSDDEMLPGHTKRLAECIAANPDSEVIGFDIAIRDSDGWTEIKSVSDSDLLRGHILHTTFATQRFVAKTDLVKSVGAWNESLPSWNDLELGVRMLVTAKNPMVFHGDAGVIVHPQDDSISSAGFAARASELTKAINEIEKTLITRCKEDYLTWTDTKRMILGALCRREKSPEIAKSIESPALKRNSGWKRRLKLRLIGATVYLSGKGGCLLSEILFPTLSTTKQEKLPV